MNVIIIFDKCKIQSQIKLSGQFFVLTAPALSVLQGKLLLNGALTEPGRKGELFLEGALSGGGGKGEFGYDAAEGLFGSGPYSDDAKKVQSAACGEAEQFGLGLGGKDERKRSVGREAAGGESEYVAVRKAAAVSGLRFPAVRIEQRSVVIRRI